LHTIDHRDKFSKCRLVPRPCRLRPGNVVKLRNRMRMRCIASLVWKPCERRCNYGRRGELRNRYVIGMPVSAIGSERDDAVGTHSPQMLHNGGDDLTRVRSIKMPVVVVQ